MGKLVIIVGGSCSGKTEFVFDQAKSDTMVICGDQYQFLDGWSIASGASDAMLYRSVWKELYLSRPGNAEPPTRDEYFTLIYDVLCKAKDCPTAIIDGMSAEYMYKFARYERLCDRDVSFVGLRSPSRDVVKKRMIDRTERMIIRGLVSEVIASIGKFGRDCWMARNSLVVRNVLKMFEQRLGDVALGDMLDEAVTLATEDKQGALNQFDCIKWREAI